MKGGVKETEIQPSSIANRDFLAEVFSGVFEGFRAYIKQRDITDLSLISRGLGLKNLRYNLRYLAQALQGTSVTRLNLALNQIDAQSAIELVENLAETNVATFIFYGNNIGNEGAISLAEKLAGTKVTTLNLERNNIGDEGAIGLAKKLALTSVTTISFAGNAITKIGAVKIIKALRGSKVHCVNLEVNHLKDESIIAMIPIIPYTDLTNISVDHNVISDQVKNDLKMALDLNAWRLFIPAAGAIYNLDTRYNAADREALENKIKREGEVDRGDILVYALLPVALDVRQIIARYVAPSFTLQRAIASREAALRGKTKREEAIPPQHPDILKM